MVQEGTRMSEDCGTPQGGVVSPILANLFMHYAFDVWMTGHIRNSHGVGMRMTDWCTVGPSKKPKPSRLSFKPGWRNATGDASDENQNCLLQGRKA